MRSPSCANRLRLSLPDVTRIAPSSHPRFRAVVGTVSNTDPTKSHGGTPNEQRVCSLVRDKCRRNGYLESERCGEVAKRRAGCMLAAPADDFTAPARISRRAKQKSQKPAPYESRYGTAHVRLIRLQACRHFMLLFGCVGGVRWSPAKRCKHYRRSRAARRLGGLRGRTCSTATE